VNTTKLKPFAQHARRRLLEQVRARFEATLLLDGAAKAENAKAIDELNKAVVQDGKERVIDRVAYTWFNRFCALRFMDVKGYSLVQAVSPVAGATQPEILAEAKQGIIRDELLNPILRKRVLDLLSGSLRSHDAQGEAYRILLVGVCNYTHKLMPYLFEKINDYTELLLPLDLLSADSVLSATRHALDEETCENVEVIGWLYQFYISEKKDEVFASNDKVKAEDIPAATQLFTPNWIVRYLVENSLGRLWMLNHPTSRLIEQMAYYIPPEQAETDFLTVDTPEALRICDPACGSGHMLVYAFDLLYAIYQEQGYTLADIPTLILTHNLFGIEIDERAGALAAFALVMKARDKNRRFFRQDFPVQPHICIMENIRLNGDEVNHYMQHIGKDLYNQDFWATVRQFTHAKAFGSLIRPKMKNVHAVQARIAAKPADELFSGKTEERMSKLLNMVQFLTSQYHVVIANPPYMGGRNMNGDLSDFAKEEYKDTKSDLFAMFIERGFELVCTNGYNAMVTMQSWMFLSSYSTLREKLLQTVTIECLLHMGNMVMGIAFGTNATVWRKQYKPNLKGHYSYVEYEDLIPTTGVPRVFPIPNDRLTTASSADFKTIPGSPIAYWVSERLRAIYENPALEEITISDGQNITGNNDLFLREHWEVSNKTVGRNNRWLLYAKGGSFRKWYGNLLEVVDWSDKAIQHYRSDRISRIIPEYLWYERGITWTLISSVSTSSRLLPTDATFDGAGSSIFFKNDDELQYTLGFLNTKLTMTLLKISNPTMSFQVLNIRDLPYVKIADPSQIDVLVNQCIKITKSDWDSYETSWDFADLPLLRPAHRAPTLASTYARLRQHGQAMTLEMQQLEEENNRIFIEAYGLEDELTAEVPLSEITLTCNPAYRYGGNKDEQHLEARLQADTMREFISYAVGCMFGRYALGQGGLILASQGETVEDYLRQVPNPTFAPDADNIIPILDGEWFPDDIVARFRQFLRLTFGEVHLQENLRFIEDALGRDLRAYFVREFYDDHLKRYSKRPIYWLFSTPKGSFNALIYMHRYRPDTVSVILNDYLREYRSKLLGRISNLENISVRVDTSKADKTAKAEKTAALKELDSLQKIMRELNDYERDVLYPLATKQLKIDLDDGVKVNYQKFGKALKPIVGLES